MQQVLMGTMCAISYGTADFLASHSSRRLHAINALAGMMLVSTLALSVLVWSFGSFESLQVSDAWIACLHGASMALALLLFFMAMELGPVSIAAPIIASHPLFVIAFAIFAGSEPTSLQILAMLGTVTGLIVVGSSVPRDGKAANILAVGAAFAASAVYAMAIIAAQEAVKFIDELPVLWLGRLSGLLFLALAYAARREGPRLPVRWWPYFAAHGLLDTLGLLFLLLGSSGELDEITAVVASTFSLVTVVLARIFLKERINVLQWLGIAVIFSSVATLATGL